jgi:hypothetical protein
VLRERRIEVLAPSNLKERVRADVAAMAALLVKRNRLF